MAPALSSPLTGADATLFAIPLRPLALPRPILPPCSLFAPLHLSPGTHSQLGVSVATAFELLAGRNVFERVDSQDAELFAAFGLACVTLAAVAAAMSQGRKNLGRRVLEPVIASLTSVQRSAASVTGQQVDSAVDYVLDGSRDINRLAKTSFVDDQLI